MKKSSSADDYVCKTAGFELILQRPGVKTFYVTQDQRCMGTNPIQNAA